MPPPPPPPPPCEHFSFSNVIHDQLVKMFHLKAICGLVGQVGFTCISEEASKVNVDFETIQNVKCIKKF